MQPCQIKSGPLSCLNLAPAPPPTVAARHCTSFACARLPANNVCGPAPGFDFDRNCRTGSGGGPARTRDCPATREYFQCVVIMPITRLFGTDYGGMTLSGVSTRDRLQAHDTQAPRVCCQRKLPQGTVVSNAMAICGLASSSAGGKPRILSHPFPIFSTTWTVNTGWRPYHGYLTYCWIFRPGGGGPGGA